MASLNGQLINAQRFAIDWKRTDDKGAFYEGDRTKNESYATTATHLRRGGRHDHHDAR